MGRYLDNGRNRKHPYMRMTTEDFDFLKPVKSGIRLMNETELRINLRHRQLIK